MHLSNVRNRPRLNVLSVDWNVIHDTSDYLVLDYGGIRINVHQRVL